MTNKPDPTRNWSILSNFASLLTAASILFLSSAAQADTPSVVAYNVSNPGSGTWTCPAGVNLVQVEVWGGGGGGGAGWKNGKNAIAGGGGGGAYARFNAYSVTPANPYSYAVGAGGTGGINNSSVNTSGTSGGDSWFVNNSTLDALGGTFAPNVTATTAIVLGSGGNGGAAGTSGDARFAGGNGAAAISSGNTAGGGGGSGGFASAGNAGSAPTGATAVTGGGAGGTGASGTTTISAGSTPGGGGGGARDTGGPGSTGAAGGSGQVQFTYYVTPTTQASGVNFSSVGSANMVISWTPGNVGSSLVLVKAGSAVDSAPVNGIIYAPNSVFASGSQLGTGNYVVYQGTGSTVTISGLTVGTTYYVAVYAVSGAGTVLAEYLTTSPATGSQATVSVPSLTSPTKSGLGLNSVTLGATLSSANGGTITEYGMVWNTSDNPTTSDHKIIAGTSVTPPSTFTVSATGLPVGSTIYYAGYAISSAGTGYSLSDSFAYSPQLYWATTSGTWNVNNSGNLVWQDAAPSTTYYQDGDQVVFNDTGSGTVTLNSTVNPASLLVSNNLSAYTITGSGTIAGSISLTKLGTNTLTLATANTYTGGTTNSAGTLALGNATALGAGSLTMNGGNLDSSVANLVTANNNPQSWNADFTFVGSQNLNLGTGNVTLGASRQVTVAANTLTVGGVVSGANLGLTKTGNGTLILNNWNTYAGGTTVNGGVLALPSNNGSSGVGSIIGSLTVNSGAEAQSGGSWPLGYGKNYVTNIVLNGGTLTFPGGSSYPNNTGFAGTNLTMTGATIQANNGGSGFDFYSGSGSSQTTYVNVMSSTVASVISCQTDLRLGTGSLVFNVARGPGTNDLLISGAIVQATAGKAGGSISKTGNGIMTLTAVNTCNNPMTISAGTLQLGDGTSGHDGAIASSVITDNATLTFNTYGSQAIAGAIGGTGQVVKNGGGTLNLSGGNSFNGGTTLSGGILNLANVSALGANGSTLHIQAVATNQLSTDTAFGGANPVYNVSLDTATVATTGTLILNRATAGASSGITHNFGSLNLSLANVPGTLNVLVGPNAPTDGAVDTIAFTSLSYGNWYTVTETIAPVGANVTLGTVAPQVSSAPYTTVATLALDGTSTGNHITGVISDNTNAVSIGYTNQAAILKCNSSKWTLSGANTYSGNTTVNGGTLALGAGGSISNTPAITVAANAVFDVTNLTAGAFTLLSNQTLKGEGTVKGNVIVEGTLAAGAGIGTLTNLGTLTWAPGGTNEVEVGSANGAPGADWDFLSISGDLNVTVTNNTPDPAQRFTIRLVSLPGGVTNLSSAASNLWPIATVSGNVRGFNAGKFNLDISSLTNAPGGSTFSVMLLDKTVAILLTPPCSYSTTNGFSLQVITNAPSANTTNIVMTFTNPGGLSSVQALTLSNCVLEGTAYDSGGTILLPNPITPITQTARTYLPSGTVKIVLTAMKLTPTDPAAVNVLVIDTCGRGKSFDPVITTLTVTSGNLVRQRFEGLLSAEHYLQVVNGTPGLKWLEIHLNGRIFRLEPLANGQEVSADLWSAMHEGDHNVVILTGGGDVGASALVTITDTSAGNLVALPEITKLTLNQTAAGLVLSWPDTATGWELQSSATADSGWTTSTLTPLSVNGQFTVAADATGGAQFYRLAGPPPAAASGTDPTASESKARVAGTTGQTSLSNQHTYEGILW